jgi:hypothetical protein
VYERVEGSRNRLNGDASICYGGGKEVGRENRLNYGKMGDYTNVTASAVIVIVKMGRCCRYG